MQSCIMSITRLLQAYVFDLEIHLSIHGISPIPTLPPPISHTRAEIYLIHILWGFA